MLYSNLLKKSLLAATMALSLSACDLIEDSPSHEVVGPNLTISAIDANTLNAYQMDDVLHLDYQLHVQELNQPNVTIDFYLVHADSANDSEIDETHFLASTTHEAVENGDFVESLRMEIPAVEHYGEYWVVAVVDPDDEVAEANEDDNHPNTDLEHHRDGEFPAVKITVEASPEHEFIFAKSYIDGGLVVLDSPEYHEGTGEHHADIIGHIDAIYHGSEAATAALTAEVLINGGYQSVQLWDSDHNDSHAAPSYQNEMHINFEHNGDEHFFGFDIALTDAQLQTLYDNYDPEAEINELSVRLTLTDTTLIGAEHDDSNNQVEITVPLYFFERQAAEVAASGEVQAAGFTNTGNKLSVDGSYDKSYGDASKFKVGVELGGELTADLLDKSAALEAGGSIDMWIFNAHNTIFGISYDAQAYLAGVNTGYDSEMIIFNTVVFEDSKWVSQFEKTFEKSWEEERILVRASFNVGPVPISISAGVDGSVGASLTIGYKQSQIYANGDILSTQFGGFAKGGVDLLLVAAGVTIELTIIDNVLAFDSSAELGLLADGQLNPHIVYAFELTDDLDVISGKFGLYAEVRSVKWCKKWFIPYPCGTNKNTYYLWFYQTPSVFKKSWTIYSKEGTLSVR
ncbi:hypothetical protein C2869_12635 [Saccharobesus litoralis]|uniref:CARDB domain-containing protein n=1 Tax=Saccharobesus litoralis TaxID=2172099 RepID=A0A2S0VSS7_9ALTE|nr:hypothetical protein [Saccharobesus litoralis]AWB67232.1 hypothetical protein C2869_12635 [Saccharobesus litoralis]